MCEPHHSIVQFDYDTANSLYAQSLIGQSLLESKRIGPYIHLSKMGAGHSGTMEVHGISALYTDERATKYEAEWWNRKVRFDEFCFYDISYVHKDPFRGEKLEFATKYANLVSIGSLSAMRRFLEVSMLHTNQIHHYVNRFRSGYNGILNNCGQLEFERKLKLISPHKMRWADYELKREQLIKLCLGFTRKRNKLVCEWADDDNLWNNKEVKVLN